MLLHESHQPSVEGVEYVALATFKRSSEEGLWADVATRPAVVDGSCVGMPCVAGADDCPSSGSTRSDRSRQPSGEDRCLYRPNDQGPNAGHQILDVLSIRAHPFEITHGGPESRHCVRDSGPCLYGDDIRDGHGLGSGTVVERGLSYDFPAAFELETVGDGGIPTKSRLRPDANDAGEVRLIRCWGFVAVRCVGECGLLA